VKMDYALLLLSFSRSSMKKHSNTIFYLVASYFKEISWIILI